MQAGAHLPIVVASPIQVSFSFSQISFSERVVPHNVVLAKQRILNETRSSFNCAFTAELKDLTAPNRTERTPTLQ